MKVESVEDLFVLGPQYQVGWVGDKVIALRCVRRVLSERDIDYPHLPSPLRGGGPPGRLPGMSGRG